MCERLHQTPSGEGVLNEDPHTMRRLEIVYGIMDRMKIKMMESPPSGS